LNAAEYLASEGNHRVIFGLRGMKTNLGDPHRNFVDFAHVPAVKRLTRMPVCIDPSHSVGSRMAGPEGILDVMHATAQGVLAGANMVLVDFHPNPAKALVDEYGSLAAYVWQWEPVPEARPRRVIRAALVGTTPESTALSKDLKRRGWTFVGPTTMYAFMQAVGLVNDHVDGCASRGAVETARRRVKRPRIRQRG